MKICDWCSNEFQANVSYQIYCSAECRELATKEKISQKHKTKRRQKLLAQKRMCLGGCGTRLSVYNETGICSTCFVNKKEVSRALKELKGLIDYERFD